MRNFILGILLATLAVIGINYFVSRFKTQKTALESSDLIVDQIKNVGKLVVTEGHFSEVITYKDAKTYYLDILTAEKKAIVVVNATVTISYDLSKIDHLIDRDAKTLTITKIPEAETTITPEIKYHDLEEDFFNQFNPQDHNLIQKEVINQLDKKVKASTLISNAENRLLSELQKLYIITNSLGWKLVYNDDSISYPEDLKKLVP